MGTPSLPVGIDLGTTNSVVARLRADGSPQVIPLLGGGTILPSVVTFDGGRVLVGAEAKEAQRLGEGVTAAFFKRAMGDRDFVVDGGGRSWDATQLSSVILRRLKESAEASLREPVARAVVTVPAYFRDPARRATILAGEQAGLEVLQVVNEPTAAAIAFGAAHPKITRRVLVYDLGGGTFDVTLVDLRPDGGEVLTSAGDQELGGKDWDDRIVDWLAARFEAETGTDPFGDRVGVADLLVAAETAKKTLSDARTATIALASGGRRGRYALSREEFEGLTKDLLERTASLVRHALEDARVAPSAVDDVVLVGGATRMPMVRAFVEAMFRRPPLTGIDPDHAVALGAAMLAAGHDKAPRAFKLPGSVAVRDVTNHSLGMIAVNAERTAYVNVPILRKNLPIPGEQTSPCRHRVRRSGAGGQLEIYMTQGESEDPRDATYLGRYVIDDLPADPTGELVLDVTYRYDASGTVHVSAAARGHGGALAVRIDALPADVPARFLRPPEAAPAPEPCTVYLCVDLSGSMTGHPLAKAQAAARDFVRNVDLATVSVGVMAVADDASTVCGATGHASKIDKAIGKLEIGMVGGGNDAHPFDLAGQELARVRKGRRVLVVLADGVWSDQTTAVTAAKRLHSQGIEVIAIGFGGADRAFLRDIASSDEAALFTSLSGLSEAFSTIAQVMTESPSTSLAAPPASGKAASPGGFLASTRWRWFGG